MGFLSSLFGVGSRTPKTETVVQAQKLPEEISPFVREILKEAQDLVTVADRPWQLIPGGFVVFAVLMFNFIGDGLRDAADPYS